MIKLVIFDVGGTLLDYQTVLGKVDVKVLKAKYGIKVSLKEIRKIKDLFETKFGTKHFRTSEKYWIRFNKMLFSQFGIDFKEMTNYSNEFNRRIKFEDMKLFPDALPVIKKLKGKFLLTTLANIPDSVVHDKVLRTTGLKEHFHFHFDSVTAGIRKPNKKIFRLVLNHFKIKPIEAVMVGDSPSADIRGGNSLSMYTILINRNRIKYSFTRLTKPDFEISSLKQLPKVLKKLENKSRQNNF